ncbi:hypothetical protein JNB88_18210 [Rhizobium cauense]|uniref:hypothetical protein n=1 Tax=Rhizobium cauense TaxID=1166683 RepID=UPI001C6EE0DB|nr:hypothetical protein [Rhizobium cauense]MBW9115574.1 hypothetical protein [Rhizobium cauense]
MTGIRSKGIRRGELASHLADLEDEHSVEDVETTEKRDLEAVQREVAYLRREVAALREQLSLIRAGNESSAAAKADAHPWLRIAATTAVTFVLGKLVQRLRLGSAGAAAVPMITAQLDRSLW